MFALRRIYSVKRSIAMIEDLRLATLSAFRSAFSHETGPSLRWKPPAEIFYDESPRHKKYTSRSRQALRATFENDGGLRHLFTKALGFEICNVRVSLNKRTLYIQWDCFANRKQDAIVAIHENMVKIRQGVGKYLGARITPRLEFRHDSFTTQQLEIDAAFAELEEREDDERLKTALGTKPHVS